ncbi:acyltransferase [Thauera mechernichensis]|uniref:Acyltransferase n=1 Tax=Thauera mechernichensis TaxID=82788 RepID=A0ABW3WDC1_9RHOO|nr:acyltransferase [Thauera mechernichensis]MDG3064867.1 acyltransferase [Thauera mechernichensis]
MKMYQDIFYALLKRWWCITVPSRLRMSGVSVGYANIFYGMPIVSVVKNSTIRLGDRVVLASHSYFTALGVARPCILRTMRPGASITIGSDSGLSGVVICAANSVKIGKECLFGADVLVADNDFHPIESAGRRFAKHDSIESAPVVIEDNVFIGTRSIVLKGVTIGSNSVIGAGSIVVSDIPPGVIAVGVPARVLRVICK